ncbi:hypothetical protein CLV67_13264 [Actinoplanes italicus]|uniref:Uncharacterized protein n=1 Tax=Actinoplanes italicus TaxID=113567 RepID=A0A2T0JTL6_9ACTN|nr:hypothetical protein CLV67_13264 [Actinoplanes italicus]
MPTHLVGIRDRPNASPHNARKPPRVTTLTTFVAFTAHHPDPAAPSPRSPPSRSGRSSPPTSTDTAHPPRRASIRRGFREPRHPRRQTSVPASVTDPGATDSPRPRQQVSTPTPPTSLSPAPPTSLSPAPPTDLGPASRTDLGPASRTDLGPTPRTDLGPTPRTTLGHGTANRPQPDAANNPRPRRPANLGPGGAGKPRVRRHRDPGGFHQRVPARRRISEAARRQPHPGVVSGPRGSGWRSARGWRSRPCRGPGTRKPSPSERSCAGRH